MRYTFLGTGAADFSPLLETELADRLDQNARRSSALLLDGTLLIDCGPHTAHAAELLGIDTAKIQNLLITHIHSDHFSPASIERLAKGKETLHLWICEEAKAAGFSPEIPGVTLHYVKPFEEYAIGGYRVTALPANHTGFPVHYSIVEPAEGRKLFYGCDGAWFLNETFYKLWNQRYDVFILDGTVGDYLGDFRMGEHNSIPMIRLMLPSLRSQGVLGPETRVYLSHIARTLHTGHEELAALLKKDGLLAAYDGLEAFV